MKKLLVVALSVMMLFSFASCNNSTPADLEVGIVADYFGAFATNHIFNQVDLELGENTDSDEISGLTTTYTPAVEASAGVEAQPAKITATFTADNLRFNGKSDNADKNQRFANGTVTVTIEGTVEDTTFTGTKMTFSGTDLSLSDNPDNYTTETAKNQLPNITTDVEITAPFVSGSVPTITIDETAKIATDITNANNPEDTDAIKINWFAAGDDGATGYVLVKPNNVRYNLADIIMFF